MVKRKLWFLIVALFAALMPGGARAKISAAFYSHELDLGLRTDFPHAFIVIKGMTPDGRAVDTNFSFTAKSVSPAILMGSVKGTMEKLKPAYYLKSEKHFEISISAAQYEALTALAAKWQAMPGKSYNLDKRNCIHFVSEAAQALGLNSTVPKALVRKPKAFLAYLKSINLGLGDGGSK
jgi:hypothetical protein